jgi:fatty acid-binding protein DegV
MSDIAMFIDSTTVMPEGFVEEHGVTVMYVPIYAGGMEYRDMVDITPEQFMTLLETSEERPSTAVPGLGEFVGFYEQLLQGHGHIVYPIPSHRLTGLYDAAIQAAEQMEGLSIVAIDPPEGWEKDVYAVRSSDPRLEERLAGVAKLKPPVIAVMNTGFASGASGLVAMAALQAMDQEGSFEQVVASMVTAKRNTNIYLVLNTLDYIVDRVGQLKAFIGTLLRIMPILTFRDGYLEDAARVRGKGQAKRRMIELLREKVGSRTIDLYVLHSLAEEEAEGLLEQARGELNVRNAWVGGIGASVSRYTGRGGLGLAFRVV